MTTYRFDDIAINSKLKKKPTEEDKLHYIGLEHLDSGSLEVVRYGSEIAPIGEKLIMQKGDVLFGKRRAYQKKVAIAPFDGIFSAHGMVLRPKENVIDKDFFAFFISSDYFLDAAIKISVGSLSPTINWSDLKELEFELPSLEKQRKLAKILWAAEETKQAYKKLLQKTDDMVKAKFEEMFGNYYNPKYPFEKIGHTGMVITGNTPTMKNKDYYETKDIQFIKPTDLKDDVVTFINTSDYYISNKARDVARIFPVHSVLVSCIGTIGKIGVNQQESCCNQQINVIIPNENMNYLYLAYALSLMKNIFINEAKSPVVPILNKSDFSNIGIIYPPTQYQNQFADFAQQAEQSKQQLQKSLDSLNSMMRALINQSFN